MTLFKRPLKALAMALLAYLLDVCVMPYLTINQVSGSVSFAMIAIVTVSYGKKAGFCMGAVIGILMEAMLASVHVLYLLLYPVIAALCAQFFGDMSERQRERRHTVDNKRRQDDLAPAIRIPLCAALSSLLMNIVLVVYGYLSGFGITFVQFYRTFVAVIYTVVIAVVLMLPVRYFLGIYGTRKERRQKRGETV